MVKLTDTFVENIVKEKSNPQRNTHLLASERKITEVGILEKYTKFEVIDLRFNQIGDMKNLGNQGFLTHLYLQNNDIDNLNGFNTLRTLQVLYLDFNKIEVVENLDPIPLKKLSLKGQKLNNIQMLTFDPACMEFLKDYIEDIVVATNKLSSLAFLRYLSNLKVLDISQNNLSNLNQVCEELLQFSNLRNLNLKHNPVMKNPDASVTIITQLNKLETFNHKEVSPHIRLYCVNLFKNKNASNSRTINETILPFINAAKRSSADLPVTLRPKITQELLDEIKKKKMKEASVLRGDVNY